MFGILCFFYVNYINKCVDGKAHFSFGLLFCKGAVHTIILTLLTSTPADDNVMLSFTFPNVFSPKYDHKGRKCVVSGMLIIDHRYPNRRDQPEIVKQFVYRSSAESAPNHMLLCIFIICVT